MEECLHGIPTCQSIDTDSSQQVEILQRDTYAFEGIIVRGLNKLNRLELLVPSFQH